VARGIATIAFQTRRFPHMSYATSEQASERSQFDL
jgi:hypothetical protein